MAEFLERVARESKYLRITSSLPKKNYLEILGRLIEEYEDSAYPT